MNITLQIDDIGLKTLKDNKQDLPNKFNYTPGRTQRNLELLNNLQTNPQNSANVNIQPNKGNFWGNIPVNSPNQYSKNNFWNNQQGGEFPKNNMTYSPVTRGKTQSPIRKLNDDNLLNSVNRENKSIPNNQLKYQNNNVNIGMVHQNSNQMGNSNYNTNQQFSNNIINPNLGGGYNNY